ncbi:DNA-3-methyladenine glycosylase-like [Argonauta hians]
MAPRKKRQHQADLEETSSTSKYFTKMVDDKSSTGNVSQFDPDLRLTATFYQKECIDLSRGLLGQNIIRTFDDGSQVCGKIVETEAYCGIEDDCCHSYNSRRTERTEAMFMSPGTLYVYTIYGMYSCMNISSSGDGCAVLIRALEPVSGLEQMQCARSQKNPSKPMKEKNLCNGPSKLCQALGISKETFNKQDLTSSQHIWLSGGEAVAPSEIGVSKRINLSADKGWVDKPLRFFIKNNPFVSVKSVK